MGSTWETLLDDLHKIRTGNFRDDAARRECLIEQMAWTLQTMLEKLRDRDNGWRN